MRRSLLPFFPLIGLVLMGNSCDFAARVGTPPPPRDAERPVEGDGGLLVVVRSGDTSALGEAQSSVAAEALVATALSMSALSVPEAATVAWSSSPTGLRPLARTEPVVAIAAPMAGRRPVGAIPEPSGWLLFMVGLAGSSGVFGRTTSRKGRSGEEGPSDPQ